jgi:hypothetical protein
LVTKRLVNQNVFDILALRMDLEVLVLKSVLGSLLGFLLLLLFLDVVGIRGGYLGLLLVARSGSLRSGLGLWLLCSHHLLFDVLDRLSSLLGSYRAFNTSLGSYGAHLQVACVRAFAHVRQRVLRLLIDGGFGRGLSSSQALELAHLSSQAFSG